MATHILVLTDFSKNAWTALSYAVDLYAGTACKFYILNAFTPSTYVSDNLLATQLGGHDVESLRVSSKKGLDTIKQLISFRDESKNHEFIYLSEFDFVQQATTKAIAKYNIDLIVMGTHGESDGPSSWFGSNTVNIMNKVRDCATLVVPRNAIYKPLKEIVFLSSFRKVYSDKELDSMIDLAKLHQAHLSVLHVSQEKENKEKSFENETVLNQNLDSINRSFHRIEDVPLHIALSCFVQIKECGMIAFVNKKHHLFEHLFSPSMVESLAKHSKVPILCMHDL